MLASVLSKDILSMSKNWYQHNLVHEQMGQPVSVWIFRSKSIEKHATSPFTLSTTPAGTHINPISEYELGEWEWCAHTMAQLPTINDLAIDPY